MSDRRIERLPTGIPGLDTILRGGLFKAGIYMVQGAPGLGKTILGNQLCFHHVATGSRALYVTLLAESHVRMLGHIGELSFFREGAIPDGVAYLSAFRVLEEEGLRGLLDLLRREIRARGITLLVLDGLVSADEMAGTPRELKKFIHELQIQASLADCTMVLLTSAIVEQRFTAAEHTMVDGLIELQSRASGRRSERVLQVHKLRGSGFLPGMHALRITDDGVVVHPRIEALLARPSLPDKADGPLLPTGIPRLDTLLGGGLSRHSTTLVIGPAGSGKSTLALQALGATPGEPSLHVSFNEGPAAVVHKARSLGLPAAAAFESGEAEILWQPATEGALDEILHLVLARVRAREVRRLVLDGIDGLGALSLDRERLGPALTALANELRAGGVTTLATAEVDLAGVTPGQPLAGLELRDLSPIADNIVTLRYAPMRAHIHRVIAVLKARDTPVDPRFHRYDVTGRGIEIAADPGDAEAILAAIARPGALGLEGDG